MLGWWIRRCCPLWLQTHTKNRFDFHRFLESNLLSSLRTASGNRHTKKITNQRECLLLIGTSETVAGYKGLAKISRSYARENPPLTVGCEIGATSHPCIFQGFDQVLPSVKITTSIFIISQSSSKRKTNKSAGYLMQSLWGMIPLLAERTKQAKGFYGVFFRLRFQFKCR